jgi:hypothetical protein
VKIITIIIVNVKNNCKYFKRALICNLMLLNHNCTYGKSPVYDDFHEDDIAVVLLLSVENIAFLFSSK